MSLLNLAKRRFSQRSFTFAEEMLFTHTESGEEASMLTGNKGEDDLTTASKWPESRVIKGESLAWLCTDREAVAYVNHHGVVIRGMRILRPLDLSNALIAFPFCAQDCVFDDDINLEWARIPTLTLVHCLVKSLNAGGIHIDNDASLCDRFEATGEVNFVGATIGGALDCGGAILNNPNGKTLFVNRAKIGSSVLLRNGFTSSGEIDLTRAEIGGNLACGDSRLTNPGKEVLSASSVKISGNVFLRNVTTSGEINLKATKILGFLACEGAKLNNPDGIALRANAAEISGDVLLMKGFVAQGTLTFERATIGGDLHCTGAKLNTDGGARLDLREASVGALRDDEASWPPKGQLVLDGFTYKRIYGDAVDVKRCLRWLDWQPQDIFQPQPYEQLASVLKIMGHDGWARTVMLEKNREHARSIRRHFKKRAWPSRIFGRIIKQEWWWQNVVGKLIGYGYRPWRAMYISLAFIMFGYLAFRQGDHNHLMVPTHQEPYEKETSSPPPPKKDRQISKDYPPFNAFVYSLETFIPLLKFDQNANWTPNANGSGGGWLTSYLYFHIIAGWILGSLWIGALTGLAKT